MHPKYYTHAGDPVISPTGLLIREEEIRNKTFAYSYSGRPIKQTLSITLMCVIPLFHLQAYLWHDYWARII